MNKFKKFAVIATLALTVSGASAVFAQDETVDPVCTDPEARIAVVADALGMTVEELEAARAEGIRLHDLADEQGIDIHDILPDCPRPENGGQRGPNLEALAEAFGITVEELQAELDAGATIHELADEYGVDLQELRPDDETRPNRPPMGENGGQPGDENGQPPAGGPGHGRPGGPGRGPQGGNGQAPAAPGESGA